eukprot:GHVP01055515.1.p1 GENE.GHVP01055515.1~~GHVP01055515.1.p1  ORF type:complete len:989 (+),score=226.16 GHVP01055515.1:304-2967(+)
MPEEQFTVRSMESSYTSGFRTHRDSLRHAVPFADTDGPQVSNVDRSPYFGESYHDKPALQDVNKRWQESTWSAKASSYGSPGQREERRDSIMSRAKSALSKVPLVGNLFGNEAEEYKESQSPTRLITREDSTAAYIPSSTPEQPSFNFHRTPLSPTSAQFQTSSSPFSHFAPVPAPLVSPSTNRKIIDAATTSSPQSNKDQSQNATPCFHRPQASSYVQEDQEDLNNRPFKRRLQALTASDIQITPRTKFQHSTSGRTASQGPGSFGVRSPYGGNQRNFFSVESTALVGQSARRSTLRPNGTFSSSPWGESSRKRFHTPSELRKILLKQKFSGSRWVDYEDYLESLKLNEAEENLKKKFSSKPLSKEINLSETSFPIKGASTNEESGVYTVEDDSHKKSVRLTAPSKSQVGSAGPLKSSKGPGATPFPRPTTTNNDKKAEDFQNDTSSKKKLTIQDEDLEKESKEIFQTPSRSTKASEAATDLCEPKTPAPIVTTKLNDGTMNDSGTKPEEAVPWWKAKAGKESEVGFDNEGFVPENDPPESNPLTTNSTFPSLFGTPGTGSFFGNLDYKPQETSLFGSGSLSTEKPGSSASLFGSLTTSTSTPAGAVDTTTGATGTSGGTDASLFASTLDPSSSSGLFGGFLKNATPATETTSASKPLFGASTTGGSLFGSITGASDSKPAEKPSTSTGLFEIAPSSGGLFGGLPGAPKAGEMFGTSTNGSASGAPKNESLFGEGAKPSATPTFESSSSTSIFGGNTAASNCQLTGASLFGDTSTNSLFGGSASSCQTAPFGEKKEELSTTSLFGNSFSQNSATSVTSSQPTSGGIFGQSQTGGLFGGTTGGLFGTGESDPKPQGEAPWSQGASSTTSGGIFSSGQITSHPFVSLV